MTRAAFLLALGLLAGAGARADARDATADLTMVWTQAGAQGQLRHVHLSTPVPLAR